VRGFAGIKPLTSENTLRNWDKRVKWYGRRAVSVAGMRDTSINPQRPTPADGSSVADLNNQLYRAYLSGDGAGVERILAQLAQAEPSRSTRADTVAA
jgi:hypothetical protein